ncbi:anthranilate synthase component I [Salinibacterium sp. dk2585]|uniref:anthranilate synthase component I n=1 Tax=unclassified Salinibacterium TaxID=2632331 RepID=UPI0011C25051|nr:MULTISPECIES: anthranilate synthase component I [unclassified Salinibacterium]QEE61256.1 anthranilate synthase component I [Salinibacterium sp. dk2585]TXK53932.1 anthranilate synthase component I [Salinibacterium sp. dk5596]
MNDSTTRAQFDALLPTHRVIPVIREVFADGETPVGIYRKLADGRPGSFLLESAEQGGIWSRFSFIGVSSFGVLTEHDDRAQWLDYGLDESRAFGEAIPDGPLAALDHLQRRWATPKVEGHPPLTGGLVGFIGWEAVRQIERLPDAPPADYDFPGQAMSFVSELAVKDHRTGSVLLVVAALNDGVSTPEELWADASARLDGLQERLSRPAEAWLAEVDMSLAPTPKPRISESDYTGMVEASKRFIRDGDVFQVVISQRFDHEITAQPIDVYRVLRTLNPSPYMYLLSLESASGEPYWVVGSSPEALVKVQDGRVFSHPIAGSRPRGATPEEDVAFADDLLRDPKERAEHLMLVDLARNDLQKVCEPGSVEVTEFMQVERYSHIMHLVSSVEGDLRNEASPLNVFTATFPAGTLSGAPKPRALEIIDELEVSRRGLYGGVVGYFGLAGDIDLAIAIRTTTIAGGVARVQAGAGLVADSDPALEHQEAKNKAAAPLRAVAIANAMRRIDG